MRKKPLAWRTFASWVATARDAFRNQAFGRQPTSAEQRRQAKLPADVRRVIRRYKPKRFRYRSVRLDLDQKKPLVVTGDLPKHVWGFKDAMETIAAIAGCSVQTLYRWEKDFRTELSQGDHEDSAARQVPRQAGWRQKGAHARRKRRDYEISE
jgi:hypothetical protein